VCKTRSPVKIASRFWISSLIGTAKIATSSAFRKVQHGITTLKLVEEAMASSGVQGFRDWVEMARTNMSGDKGSPCQRPHPWDTGMPATPLRRTGEVEVERKGAI
jgi:hypothetical protein